ncbi:MAG: enoyl-CoA hydratase-related protein [Saprospiraceae bacterium]|nr:enoyl-CoA hydratase-related protein [Saprospiraceae bacterium]
MEYTNLLVEEQDGIFVLTINRERALNALNKQTMSELEHFFRGDAARGNEVKGVIIKGAGDKAFVAGADIKEFLAIDAAAGADMARKGQEVFFLIEQFDKPVIAAINGFALGGGCELAMACHMRLATPAAKFGQPEVNLGLIPGYGGTQRLIQYIGKTKAVELLMTGGMLSADEALQLGLVNYVVPAEELMDKANALIGKVARKGPVAISKVIEAVNAYFDNTKEGFDAEVSYFEDVCGTEDFKIGANAFINKEKPRFTGK